MKKFLTAYLMLKMCYFVCHVHNKIKTIHSLIKVALDWQIMITHILENAENTPESF